MKKYLSRILSLALVGAILLSGCSSTPAPAESDEPAESEASQASEVAGEETETRDTLVIGHWSDPPNLDPNNSLNDCSMRVTTNIYDTLIRMDGNC